MKFSKTVLMLAAICAAGICAADIQLAREGKALYTIVERPGAAQLEKDSVKDLKYHLDKITGADFKIGKADSKRIFIGVRAPGDNKPFAKAERRIKAVNGDIYIYGEGTDGAAWGIYDLLEKHLGCRWYTAWGDEKIPRNADLSVPELDESVVPPFWRFETASMSNFWRSPRMRAFLRRRRVHITPDKIPGDDSYLLGFPLHTFCKYIPAGNVPKGKFVDNIGDAYKYFADKKYYETNPEWFTMDENGKRVRHQLCLSNKELRKEFLKNLEIVIKNEYKGGDAVIVVDMNDRAHYLCKCPECKKLIDKYETEGGPLYDYLIELGGIFAKKYPRIVIRSLAYGCSQVPPNCDLPDNVMMWYAPLAGGDFFKNFRNSPDQKALNDLKKHGVHSKALWKWMYVTHFYSKRGHTGAQIVANMQRIADNLRIYHENKIRCIMTELGLSIYGFYNFQEMRMNMIYALKDDLNIDEKAVNREYMEFCYGRAAGKMGAFLAELEELSAGRKDMLRWRSPFPWQIGYLTPANLLRWEKDLLAMEKMVADDRRQLLHVQKVRLALDQAILGKWHDICAFDSTCDDARYAAVRKRYVDTLDRVMNLVFQDHEVSPKILESYRNSAFRYNMRPILVADKLKERGAAPDKAIRPLPEKFAGIPAARIIRIPFMPKDGSKPQSDPDGAFGISMPGNGTLYPRLNFMYLDDTYENRFANVITIEEIRSKPLNKFNYYFLGRHNIQGNAHISTVITAPESQAVLDVSKHGLAMKADIYISIRYDGKNKMCLDEILMIKQ